VTKATGRSHQCRSNVQCEREWGAHLRMGLSPSLKCLGPLAAGPSGCLLGKTTDLTGRPSGTRVVGSGSTTQGRGPCAVDRANPTDPREVPGQPARGSACRDFLRTLLNVGGAPCAATPGVPKAGTLRWARGPRTRPGTVESPALKMLQSPSWAGESRHTVPLPHSGKSDSPGIAQPLQPNPVVRNRGGSPDCAKARPFPEPCPPSPVRSRSSVCSRVPSPCTRANSRGPSPSAPGAAGASEAPTPSPTERSRILRGPV
jgi:hypothetical protein